MEDQVMRILVAVDGSDNSMRALIEAKKYGELVRGEVTILTVVKAVPVVRYGYLDAPQPDENEQLKKAGEEILKESLKTFDSFKGDVKTKLRKGNPADEILNEAEEEEYDLIILGSRGLGVFSRSFLGSVSNKVLNHTDTNVLIIK